MSKKHKIKYCEKCGIIHDGKYGSGRFCSEECARSFSASHVTKEGRQKQIEALTNPNNKNKEKKKKKKDKKKKLIEAYNDLNYNKMNTVTKSIYKGKIGEFSTIKKFLENNIPVYLPVVDDGVDMIVNINNEFKTVQVKSSSHLSGIKQSQTTFKLTKNKRNIHKGSYTQKSEKYSDEIDYFALYDLNFDDVYLLKNEDIENKSSITIRHFKPSGTQTIDGNYDIELQIDRVLELEKNGINPSDIIEVEYKEIDDK